ncbi:MAG: hypothetical protein IKS83_00445, partial [Victivallales bacterium]|nr:hypothetical protein [Victivallales bacterium]
GATGAGATGFGDKIVRFKVNFGVTRAGSAGAAGVSDPAVAGGGGTERGVVGVEGMAGTPEVLAGIVGMGAAGVSAVSLTGVSLSFKTFNVGFSSGAGAPAGWSDIFFS